MKRIIPLLMIPVLLVAFSCQKKRDPVRPVAVTPSVASIAGDAAVWVHPVDPSRSLILGTDRSEA